MDELSLAICDKCSTAWKWTWDSEICPKCGESSQHEIEKWNLIGERFF